MVVKNNGGKISPHYVVTRHRYDSETNHYRWMTEVTFESKRKWKKYLKKEWADLEVRLDSGKAQQKEELSGYVLNPKNRSHTKTLFIKLFRVFKKNDFLPGYQSGYVEYEEYLESQKMNG